jgi:O-antigen/teichoic acid export membrane protein
MQQLKNIFLILLSTVIGWVGSYLYHPVMNAYLEVSDFARFESLIGIFTILTTITAGFWLYLTRTFSQSKSTHTALYKGSQRVFFYIGIVMYVVYLCFVSWIDWFLMIWNWMIVALIGLIIPFSFISITPNSWIQSHGKFW